MSNTRPILATYQDIACLSAEASRTVGLSSDSYVVTLGWDAVASPDVAVRPPTDGPVLRALRSDDNEETLRPKRVKRVADAPLEMRGDLTLESYEGPGSFTRFQDLYVRDDGVRIVSRTLSAVGGRAEFVVQLELVDVRYFWSDRGAVLADLNLRDKTGDRWFPASVFGGEPGTLEEILVFLVQLLPGSLPVGRVPDWAKDRDQPPEDLSWRFDKPVDALAYLVKKFGLVPSLTPSNTVNFDEIGVGAEGYGVENVTPLEDRFRRDRIVVTGPSYAPVELMVVGAPIQQTLLVPGWDSVGVALDGTIQPVADALASYSPRLTPDAVGAAILLDDERVKAFLEIEFDLLPNQVDFILSWAGRMFRMPGANGDAVHLLPIEDQVEVDSKGDRIAPLVESRRWTARRLRREEVTDDPYPADLVEDAGRTLESAALIDRDRSVTIRPRGTESEAEQVAREVIELTRRIAGRRTQTGDVSAEVLTITDKLDDRDLYYTKRRFLQRSDPRDPIGFAIVKIGGKQERFVIARVREGDQTKLELVALEQSHREEKRGPIVIRERVEGASPAPTFDRTQVIVVNGALMRREPQDYTLDRANGILIFNRPMGVVVAPRGGFRSNVLDFSTEAAAVTVTFGTTLKPNPEGVRVEMDMFWYSSFRRQGTTIDPLPGPPNLTLYPKVIVDESLVLQKALDGSSNRNDLERRSRQIAIDSFDRLDTVEDVTTVMAGCWPIECNGRIFTTSWLLDADPPEARATYRMGSFLGIEGGDGAGERRRYDRTRERERFAPAPVNAPEVKRQGPNAARRATKR